MDSIEEWLDNLDVDPSVVRDAVHMRRIRAATQALASADAELTAAVTAARDAGDSWAMVGVGLGVSRQAAEQWFDSDGGTHYQALLEEIEDLKDRLSVHERTGNIVPAAQLRAELGLSKNEGTESG